MTKSLQGKGPVGGQKLKNVLKYYMLTNDSFLFQFSNDKWCKVSLVAWFPLQSMSRRKKCIMINNTPFLSGHVTLSHLQTCLVLQKMFERIRSCRLILVKETDMEN